MEITLSFVKALEVRIISFLPASICQESGHSICRRCSHQLCQGRSEWHCTAVPQETAPLNLDGLQSLCCALTAAALQEAEDPLSVKEYLKVRSRHPCAYVSPASELEHLLGQGSGKCCACHASQMALVCYMCV